LHQHGHCRHRHRHWHHDITTTPLGRRHTPHPPPLHTTTRQVLGYDDEGRVLNYVGVAAPTPAGITAAASRVLNFIDMGGHEKYMKTTLYGMTCLLPGARRVHVAHRRVCCAARPACRLAGVASSAARCKAAVWADSRRGRLPVCLHAAAAAAARLCAAVCGRCQRHHTHHA
jgi:hypothetical protein